MADRTRKQSFIQGTMILLAAGIINRLLGFVPRIALPRVIGAEGVGLYQMGYPLLIVLLTVITGGIPLAVAKLVAEGESTGDKRRVRNVLKYSLWLTTVLSIIFTAVCLTLAPWISTRLLTDSRVYYTFVSMSPMFLIIGISSVFRGYFQGLQNMIPTALSQIIETLVRIVAMLFCSYMLLPYGVEFAAAGAMIGVLAGEVCGMLVLLQQFYLGGGAGRSMPSQPSTASAQSATGMPDKPGKWGKFADLRSLLRISIPVAAGKLVGSGSYFLESIMIARSLAIAGIATTVATAQYGALQGMIIPIVLLPSALTYSLAVSLIPSLSEAAAVGDMKTIHKRLHQSLRLALVTGAPFAVMMYVLADPLCYYIYNNTEIAGMLKLMAPIALFLYFQAPLQAALQALDRPGTALMNTFIGACVKLSLIAVLASKPQFGIIGALLAINVNIVLVTLLHGFSVSKLTKFSMQLGDFFKVGIGMALMGTCCYYVMSVPWTSSPFTRFVASSITGVLLYLLLIFAMKLVDRYDLVRLPWIGRKFIK